MCSVSVFSVLSIFADYPVCEFFIHDLKVQMTKLGSNMVEHRVLGKNLQYKQKSLTFYVNSKHLLVSYVCIVHIMNKLPFYFLIVAEQSVFVIIRVLQLLVHSLPTIITLEN